MIVLFFLIGAEFRHTGFFGFYGGQYFFKNEAQSTAGNTFISYSPAFVWDSISVVPQFNIYYAGTKSAKELAGGATLFQDSLDLSGQVSFVKKGGFYKLVALTGYTNSYLRETRDETIGKGLFDYRSINAAVSADFEYKNWRFTPGIDYYTITFPNYQTLESSTQTLARELSDKNALDTVNTGISIATKFKNNVTFSYSVIFRNFTDQRVVLITGDKSDEKRKDVVQEFRAGFKTKTGKNTVFYPSIGLLFRNNSSNQNNYDARNTKFNESFYSYTDSGIVASIKTAFINHPFIYTLSYSYTDRKYANRPVQDEKGTYLDDRIFILEKIVSIGIDYPVTKTMKFSFNATFGDTYSNMKYEKLYKYTYTNSNYFIGFEYGI